MIGCNRGRGKVGGGGWGKRRHLPFLVWEVEGAFVVLGALAGSGQSFRFILNSNNYILYAKW